MYKRGKASNVFIEKNIVEKVFDYDVDKGYRGNGQQSYQREKEALLRLKGNKHFPQIINFDDKKRLIQMSYCGESYPFDGKPRPHLLEQVWEISEAIEKANIKLLGFGLQTNNILLHDGVLKIIDFEYSLPEGMKEIDEFDPRFLKHIRDNWDVSFWENCFKILPRQALHAKTLGFVHPKTGDFMEFDSELPEDFKSCIEKWENYTAN